MPLRKENLTMFGKTTKLAVAGAGALAVGRVLRARRRIDFGGKTVLITGASRGLGLVLARLWADEGARLAILARNADDLERARQELEGRGAQVLAIPCDVRDRAAVEAAVEQTVARFGGVDILVNNAGIIQAGPLEHMQQSDFEDALATHMWGPLFAMNAVIPHMRRAGGGRIVNVSSIGGKIGVPHLVPYSASKFALVGLSQGMGAELRKDNIRVTTVSPGLMRTGSPPNALFKGQHEAEYAWFVVADSSPLSSISAERAAAQIVDACRHGDADLVISVQALLATRFAALFPELTAALAALAARFLPGPTGPEGDQAKRGYESESAIAPSILTTLTEEAAARNNETPQPATVDRRPMTDDQPTTEGAA
jgi:NAD(P)-dependent dehydrogenase (short-subunit alcohol dehydrogenase family)